MIRLIVTQTKYPSKASQSLQFKAYYSICNTNKGWSWFAWFIYHCKLLS